MEVIETLNKMKDVLMEDGWCKTSLHDPDGKVCLVGARNKVLGYAMTAVGKGYRVDYSSDLIESVLPLKCRRLTDTETRAWVINDEASSLNDVLDVIDQALIAEKERNHGTH